MWQKGQPRDLNEATCCTSPSTVRATIILTIVIFESDNIMIVSCQWREHTAKTKATDAHRRSWRWPPASRVRGLMVHGKTTGPSINQSISQSICRKLTLNCVAKIWLNLFQDCNISNNDFHSDDDFHNWSIITLEKLKNHKFQELRVMSSIFYFVQPPVQIFTDSFTIINKENRKSIFRKETIHQISK